MWCQDSPNESTDSQNTFVDLSSVSNRRRPKKWQIELIEKVTWWTRNTRISPAQKKAVIAAVRLPPTSQPTAAGSTRPSATQSGNSVLMILIPRSSTRSGAYLSASTAVEWSKSQPMWAW